MPVARFYRMIRVLQGRVGNLNYEQQSGLQYC